MKATWIRKAHRWLGLVFSIFLLMSSGSGVLHIVMTRTQSSPPPARPAGGGLDAAAIRVTAAEAVEIVGGEQAQAINLRSIGGRPAYQLFYPGESRPRYVDAVEGRADPELDEAYAAEIAAGFLGGAEVKKAGYLTGFDKEYLNIFRVLPVYRFDTADGKGTRVYVSTVTGSVTRHTDDAKQLEAGAFTNLHKFGFIPDKDARDLVLGGATAGVFLASVLGIVLFFLTRPRRRQRPAGAT